MSFLQRLRKRKGLYTDQGRTTEPTSLLKTCMAAGSSTRVSPSRKRRRPPPAIRQRGDGESGCGLNRKWPDWKPIPRPEPRGRCPAYILRFCAHASQDQRLISVKSAVHRWRGWGGPFLRMAPQRSVGTQRGRQSSPRLSPVTRWPVVRGLKSWNTLGGSPTTSLAQPARSGSSVWPPPQSE